MPNRILGELTMRHTNTHNPMTKEDIFKQLDKLPTDFLRGEFIAHLYKMGTITGEQAISYAKEYNERKAIK